METVEQTGLNQLINTFIDQIIFPGRGYKKLNQNGGYCLDVGGVWMVIGHEHLPLPIDARHLNARSNAASSHINTITTTLDFDDS
jgi:3-deoxy-D-arabino-heptulosonate 7-phosphate (DAHP) synthase